MRVIARNTLFPHDVHLQGGAGGVVAGIADADFFYIVEAETKGCVVVVVRGGFIGIDRVFVASVSARALSFSM